MVGLTSILLLNLRPSPIVLRVNEILVSSLIPVVVEEPPPNVATLVKLLVSKVAKSTVDPVWIVVVFNPAPTAEPENPTTVPLSDALKVPFNPAVPLISSTNCWRPAPV